MAWLQLTFAHTVEGIVFTRQRSGRSGWSPPRTCGRKMTLNGVAAFHELHLMPSRMLHWFVISY